MEARQKETEFKLRATENAPLFPICNRFPKAVTLLWISFLLACLPGVVYGQTESQTAAGSIHGTVKITRKLSSQRMRFRLYPGFKPQPPPDASSHRSDEWQNIIVYLKSDSPLASPPAPGDELQIAQEGETFIPHVLPVVKGSSVAFPNHDPIFHNVFSLSAASTFDLGRYPKGSSKSVVFDQVGIVPVFCHLHSNMSAIILVLDNPYFAVPGPEGNYQIRNIPAGGYTLVAWHERSEPVEQEVEVVSGQDIAFDLTVPIDDEDVSDN